MVAGLLLIAAGSATFAFANAGTVTTLGADALLPSQAPPLLGPIDERGRTGWQCKPELAASASNAVMADLPQVSN